MEKLTILGNDCLLFLYRIDTFDKEIKALQEDFGKTKTDQEKIDNIKKQVLIYKRLYKEIKQQIKLISFLKITDNTNINLYNIMEYSIKGQLSTIREIIYSLTHHKFYLKHEECFIGGNFSTGDMIVIIYGNCCLEKTKPYQRILFKKEFEEEKNIFINILSYIYSTAVYILTKNIRYNKKLETAYNQFDILDLLKLSDNKWLENNIDTKAGLTMTIPILKRHKETYKIVVIPTIKEPNLFALYNDSLKQIEPLSRCTFLWRIVEYESVYYKEEQKPLNFTRTKMIEEYYHKSIRFNLTSVIYEDHGMSVDQKKQEMVTKKKEQCKNLITELKKLSKNIIKKRSKDPKLKEKSLGEIIYYYGRNLTAHGGNSNNINHDYGNSYSHINNVNVILELIVRYIIEKHNPEIKDVIYQRKDLYIKNMR